MKMIRKSKCIGLVIVGLSLLLSLCAYCGNELRLGEVIWECGDYAWRSLIVPDPRSPGEYYDIPRVVGVDPDGNTWVYAPYNMMRFDGVDFEVLENMPMVRDPDHGLAIGRDRSSGDGYAAWFRRVVVLWPRGSETYVGRYQDGEYVLWRPHTHQHTDGCADEDVGIDSSGLVCIPGYISGKYGVFCIDGDPNLSESWDFEEFEYSKFMYIDCGRGKSDRCLLGLDGHGVGWVNEDATHGTVVDLEALGGSNSIWDIALSVSDQRLWVSGADGLFWYDYQDDCFHAIDSHKQAEEDWSRYWVICADDSGGLWANAYRGLVLYSTDEWRRFPFPEDLHFAGTYARLVVDNDAIPWVQTYHWPTTPENVQLALYWQDCKVQVRTDRSEYEAGDSVEMSWSLKNLGPTVTGSLYVGVVTPWGDVMCWAIDGWRPDMFPVLAEASYIPGLMFKPISFATVPITESTPPGEYSLATAIVGTSGELEAYHACSFTIKSDPSGIGGV